MADVRIESAGGELSAYVATPAGPPPWPGVVLLHDVFGMSEVLRHHADWLASEGYLAAAPNLFRSGGKISCIRAALRDTAAGRGPTFDDVEATRRWLVAQAGCSGRVGAIGFCLGGGFALLLAANHGFSVSCSNYGRLPKDAEAALEGACPIVGSYGGKDRGLRGAAARLEAILEAKGVPHDVKEYPGAGHSFLDDFTMGGVPKPLLVLMKLMGTGYQEAAAADARRRIVAFFDAQLKAAG